jgi:iron complex outermembrane receptor protein
MAQTADTSPPIRRSQDVTVTATLTPIAAEWSGRTVIALSAADLARLGIRSLADAARLAPGVDVRARAPFDVQTDFSIRGATFGQSLVLIDGLRLNDSQSGHHNGDIPAMLAGIERIEIATGPGSAAHGADALGGTINVITRRDAHVAATFATGQNGYVIGQFSAQGGRLPSWLNFSAWGARSSGFEDGREFAQGGGSVGLNVGGGWTMGLRHVNKAFGAKNFYGPSPSKEWTDQTMASAVWRRTSGSWTSIVEMFARNHGDHFRWDVNRPGVAENTHRTNAGEGRYRAQRLFDGGAGLSLGGGGGGDWVRSSNLGNHSYGRAHVFAELQQPLGTRALVTAGARVDTYSSFGESFNPSLSGVWQLSRRLRLRSSTARAFRVPTYTELYYHDPANLGTPDLKPEYGWSVDGGIEWSESGWTLAATPFVRWDHDVIDWVRPSTADLWRSTNLRDVTSQGTEFSAMRHWKNALLRGHVSLLGVDAASVNTLSKYVLEYAKQSVGFMAAAPLGRGAQGAVTIDYRHRADGQKYTLVGAKVAFAIRRTELFVDGTNLLNESYHEIAGVSMPGRWLTVGLTIRP